MRSVLFTFAIAATMGTTATGAIDDVGAIATIAKRFDLWLHVDCCYGGAAALLDEYAGDFSALHLADSVAVDPHKWFFLPIIAGLALTKHADVEREAFDLETSYIPGDGELDAFCRGLPTSRRNMGISVWATLRAHGFDTIRAAVRRNIRQMRRLENRLEAEGCTVLPDARLSIACVRVPATGLDEAALDTFQGQIAEHVQAEGKAWFSTTRHGGRTWLRFNTVNLHTRNTHIDEMADLVLDAAAALQSR